MKCLDIQNLQINYKHDNGKEILVCDKLSFSISEGEIVGIFGPNGSGKTSLLRVLLNLKQFSKGEIKFSDKRRGKYSYIPQQIENSFFSWLSVRGNIAYVTKEKSKTKKLEKLWEEFSLNYDFEMSPMNCSGGMLQQAAIVRAFINDPDIIIGDEPFSALDVETAGRIRSIFRDKIKRTGAMAILAMHNVDDLMAICDKILFIPNKPYSTIKDDSLHRIKIYKNKNVLRDKLLDKESSLTSTIDRLFS